MADVADVPIFSDRLTEVLITIHDGKAPNAGRFCGYCYTPMDKDRTRCPHCDQLVADVAPVTSIPEPIMAMYKKLRRRESLVVNGFAYVGLLSAVAIFIVVVYILFSTAANVWWYVLNIVMLFILARVLAGLVGGWVGDEVGYHYARRKLAEDWVEYEAGGADAATVDADRR